MIYVVPQRGIVVNVCILYIGIIFPPTFSTEKFMPGGRTGKRADGCFTSSDVFVCGAQALSFIIRSIFCCLLHLFPSYVISCVMFKLYLIFHLARLKLLRYEGIIFQGLGVV